MESESQAPDSGLRPEKPQQTISDMVPEQRHASWLPTAYSTSVGPGFRFFLNFGMRISGLPGYTKIAGNEDQLRTKRVPCLCSIIFHPPASRGNPKRQLDATAHQRQNGEDNNEGCGTFAKCKDAHNFAYGFYGNSFAASEQCIIYKNLLD